MELKLAIITNDPLLVFDIMEKKDNETLSINDSIDIPIPGNAKIIYKPSLKLKSIGYQKFLIL
jgi:hypothetical protein